MTDDQINQAIYEACGDYVCECCKDICKDCDRNYCTDLNAMHEAEKVLSVEQIAKYFWLLCDISKKNNPFMATARQRAEAFLRTIGKWEGD
jgi:hypothetical protein